MDRHKTKSKVVSGANHSKENVNRSQRGTWKLSEARENAGDLVAIDLCFESDWSRKWHDFSRPITENKAKPKHCGTTFNIQLNISLSSHSRPGTNWQNGGKIGRNGKSFSPNLKPTDKKQENITTDTKAVSLRASTNKTQCIRNLWPGKGFYINAYKN